MDTNQTMVKPLVVVQSLSHAWLCVTPCTATHQASLSFTISRSLLTLMSIELMIPSNHLILCCPLSCPQSFPASESFPMSQLFTSGGQNIGASASVLSMNIQGWFPLGLTSLISLLQMDSQQSFPAPQLESINYLTLSLLYGSNSHIHTWLLEKT